MKGWGNWRVQRGGGFTRSIKVMAGERKKTGRRVFGLKEGIRRKDQLKYSVGSPSLYSERGRMWPREDAIWRGEKGVGKRGDIRSSERKDKGVKSRL